MPLTHPTTQTQSGPRTGRPTDLPRVLAGGSDGLDRQVGRVAGEEEGSRAEALTGSSGPECQDPGFQVAFSLEEAGAWETPPGGTRGHVVLEPLRQPRGLRKEENRHKHVDGSPQGVAQSWTREPPPPSNQHHPHSR